MNVKKGTKLPDPITVERPGRQEPAADDGRARLSVAELAALPGLTADLREAK